MGFGLGLGFGFEGWLVCRGIFWAGGFGVLSVLNGHEGKGTDKGLNMGGRWGRFRTILLIAVMAPFLKFKFAVRAVSLFWREGGGGGSAAYALGPGN